MMYLCTQCSYKSPTKLGKCPLCESFDTFVSVDSTNSSKKRTKSGKVLDTYHKQSGDDKKFFFLTTKELTRTFGKGIKRGGVYLLAGEPGIGKSTLILQIIHDILSNQNACVAYCSAEEQAGDIYDRRNRLYGSNDFDPNIFMIFPTFSLEDCIATIEHYDPDIVIIDSIQTIYSPILDSIAGSIQQVRYCAEKLLNYAKSHDCTIFIIGHVTKGGEIAGPKYLEHIVDVVLYLEGDRFGQLRFLRSQKNRFGCTDDTGIFQMTGYGLQPVYDISERILEHASVGPGNVLCVGLDNGRPVLSCVETLLHKTDFKFPQRSCIGLDPKRVDLVIAILEKYLRINLSIFDIFVNIPGEFSFRDSGMDLAIATSIYSQRKNITCPGKFIFIGELALSGKVNMSKLHEKRIKEFGSTFTVYDYKNCPTISQLPAILENTI